MGKYLSIAVLFFLASLLLHAGEARFGFASVKETEASRALLSEIGIVDFVEKACTTGVSAPGIHSKYWVDRFTRDNPEKAALETAYRDFGLAVAKQLDRLAIDIYRNPKKGEEVERVEWFLRFSWWFMRAGKFENYRLALRAEEAATIPLLRSIVDMDVPVEKLTSVLARFSTCESTASMRADILCEESNGAFDMRLFGMSVLSDDMFFLRRWEWSHWFAYRHFGNRLKHYTDCREEVQKEPDKYAFFTDDEPAGRVTDSSWWDRKLHKFVCVFRSQVCFLRSMKEILEFRKDGGVYVDAPKIAGMTESKAYEKYYRERYAATKASRYSGVAADYCRYNKNNTYLDFQTECALDEKERKEMSKRSCESNGRVQ